MVTNKTKTELIKDYEKRIACREQLFGFIATEFLPTLKQFDGKVYNIRFIKALREKANQVNDFINVRELQNGSIIVEISVDRYNYCDTEQIYIKFPLKDNRTISFDLVTNDEVGQKWIKNFKETTEEYREVIDNYDKYMEIVERFEQELKVYNNLPFMFRNNINKNYLHIY